MADTIQYGMGQIRYSNTSTYMSNCNFTFEPVQVFVSSSSQDVYQDVILKGANFSFDSSKSYLVKLTIPKNVNYNNTYRVKLIANSDNETLNPDSVAYQMLKYINVPKETNSLGSNSRVIIYPVKTNGLPGINDDETYTTKVAIATDEDHANIGDVIFNQEKYFLKTENSNIEIQNKNDVILNHVWTSEHSISGASFMFIFTPRDEGVITYNQIWIEMLRETYDQDIYNNNIYGRRIDLDINIFKAEVYELKNLIGQNSVITDATTLNHIGVYSHPNIMMAINGEEIRVGQSGYYELNNFDITSLAIAAENDNDKFILDYQYKITTN